MPYTTATVSSVDPVADDGSRHVVVTFTGDAGEPAVQRDYALDENFTTQSVRQWVFGVLARLNGRKSTAGSVTNGQIIPPLAPPAAPAQTAAQIWADKARRLARLRAMGTVTGALATAITALQTDVDSSYQAGFVDGV